jgi:beta-lactamase class D/beta-lactamase regulating signal transducer with metallopeptidase domain
MISQLLIQLGRASLLGGALLLCVWAALSLMPRLSPSTRCWLWRLASLKLLVLLTVAGSITIPLLPEGSAKPAAPLPAVSEGVEVGSAGAVAQPPTGDDDSARWPLLLFGLWALGVGLGGIGLISAFLQARRLRRAARPVADPDARAALAALAARMRVPLPRLARSDRVGSPLVVGWRDPVIVIPGAALRSETLEPLLAHELAHVRRRDLLWSWVALSCRLLLFFHPLAWVAERELRREQERAADAEALEAAGLCPERYAGALLATVTVALKPLPLTSAAVSSGYADLRARIQRLACRPPRWARPVGALLVALSLLALPPWRLTRAAPAALQVDAKTVKARFARAGFEGCFLLKDTGTGEVVSVGGERCAEAHPPCSTFKLPHAMIALDAGVLAGPDVRFRWDGRRKAFKAWQRDHTLKSAFRHSVVWVFQRVARKVGAKRMRRYLDRLGYGDRKMGAHRLTRFWIDGTLRITPRQQLAFLTRLYGDKLGLSRRAQRLGRELVAGAGGGKTGTCMVGGKLTTGWYVGHRRHAGRGYVFVTLIQAKDGAWGREARKLSHKILKDAGLM